MISRYELFSNSVACLYRDIQKLERVEMEKYGLKGPHAQCLLSLSRYPRGLIATQLCEMCEKDKAAISRTISELEQEGLLDRDAQDGNRYRAIVKLTERGREAAARVSERVRLAVERAGEGLNDAQRAIFYNVLHVIAANLQNISADGLAEV